MLNPILHIPHSSDKIPFTTGYVVNQEILDAEILKLTDWYTDDLFTLPGSKKIKANFSRIFCDTERFTDDAQEVMAKYGMGVLYERADDGTKIRDISPELREDILSNFYWPHHQELNAAVESQLEANGKALIVDGHSYPSSPLVRDLSQEKKRPDFNIGTDSFHTPPELITLSKAFFSDKGYTLGVDWPYSGSLVPLNHYQKSKNVHSIMLEINRTLYLREPSSEKSEGYAKTKEIVREYLEVLQEAYHNGRGLGKL